jgi:3-methyladenine DNA glycosylase AlkD
MNLNELKKIIASSANKKHAEVMQRFFKTGKGEYGEGDKFVGIKVPVQRKIALRFYNLELTDLQKLLKSPVHEERLISLLILVNKYRRGHEKVKERIFKFYLKNRKRINNWDLVDLSAPKIVGDFLLDRNKKILFALAHSPNLWERRIAIISTFTFIRNENYKPTVFIAKVLLNDDHDLIHKAVGWMLREIGNRDVQLLEKFLRSRYRNMPRTMLRYAIEKFPEAKRKKYLNGQI